MSKEWHVEYRIEVEAESAEEAARKVAVLLANGGAERGVYHVHERTAVSASAFLKDETEVDLGTIDGTWEEPVMQHFTSGYRAAHGLPSANHDPLPWAFSRTSPDRENGPFGHSDRAATRVDAAMLWFPRPEFDVPDNLILVELRACIANGAPFDGMVQVMLNSTRNRHIAIEGCGPTEIDHARRVLAKLAAVYA